MKKTTKIFIVISSILVTFVFLLFVGGSLLFHKVIAEETTAEFTYFQSVKAILNFNADGKIEKQIKDSYSTMDHHHISIYYEAEFAELLPLTKETIDWAIKRNKEIFGETKSKSMDFIVFEETKDLTEFSGLEQVGGYYTDLQKVLAISYRDKELILKSDEMALYDFQQMILHEYTHYVFSRKGGDAAMYPHWFGEGLAEYIGNDQHEVSFPHFERVSFKQLTTIEQWQAARLSSATDVYLQSYFAVEYLTGEFGEEVISQLMNSVEETKNFDESLKQVTGLTIMELEKNFLKAYKN